MSLYVVRGKRTLSSISTNLQNICNLIGPEEYSIGHIVLWSQYLAKLALLTQQLGLFRLQLANVFLFLLSWKPLSVTFILIVGQIGRKQKSLQTFCLRLQLILKCVSSEIEQMSESF